MVFGVAGPSNRLLDFGVQLLGLFIVPVGALAFNPWRCPNVDIPGTLQGFSSFCGSARLAGGLLALFLQLLHGFIRRSMWLCVLLRSFPDPFVIVASHGVCEAFIIRTWEGLPVAVLECRPVGAGIVFSFDASKESGVADTFFLGLDFRHFACDV